MGYNIGDRFILRKKFPYKQIEVGEILIIYDLYLDGIILSSTSIRYATFMTLVEYRKKIINEIS